MKFVIQRVSSAKVTVDGQTVGEIAEGFVVLVGVCDTDTYEIADKMIHKLLNLRIFSDENGKTNLDLKNIGGELLIVSQFTLYADTTKGRRPSYVSAMKSAEAKILYELWNKKMSAFVPVKTGVFGAEMEVSLINDGPITIVMESREKVC